MNVLDLQVTQYGSPQEICGNIRGALARGLPELAPALCSHDGTFVIVGSGPSMPQFVDDLRSEKAAGRPICAVNHAHDFLVKQDIEPTFFLTIDPRPRADYHLTTLPQETIYLLASRVHPEMFDRLKDHKVMLWHAWADQDQAEDIWDSRKAFLIGGGTTSGIRAINVGYLLGFRKFVLYGLDSCLAPDGKTKRFNGDGSGQMTKVQVGWFRGAENGCDPQSREFVSNYAMAQQANDFNRVFIDMPDARFDVKGDGLLAAIVAQRKAMGLPA